MKINTKNPYIRGYGVNLVDGLYQSDGGLSITDQLIAGTKNEINFDQWGKADWEIIGKKNEISDFYGLERQGHMNSFVEEAFKYSLNIDDYEDPTYLMFNTKFLSDTSPLFNYGNFANNPTGASGDTTFQRNSSAPTILDKYKNIDEMAIRIPIYYEFIELLTSIFSTTFHSTPWVKSYYIEMITGLDKLNAKMVKYDDKNGDKITIQLSEDVAMRATYLAEMYNNLCYSFKDQRYMIPDNCLRFDLMIEITDIRLFKIFDGLDDNDIKKFSVNNNPPSIIYTLYDCNFDFFQSQAFDAGLQVGGVSSAADKKAANLSFDIKYKSISREFKSPIINSPELNNKLSRLVYSDHSKFSRKPWFERDIMTVENKMSDEPTTSGTTLNFAPEDLLIKNHVSKVDSMIGESNSSLYKLGNFIHNPVNETGTTMDEYRKTYGFDVRPPTSNISQFRVNGFLFNQNLDIKQQVIDNINNIRSKMTNKDIVFLPHALLSNDDGQTTINVTVEKTSDGYSTYGQNEANGQAKFMQDIRLNKLPKYDLIGLPHTIDSNDNTVNVAVFRDGTESKNQEEGDNHTVMPEHGDEFGHYHQHNMPYYVYGNGKEGKEIDEADIVDGQLTQGKKKKRTKKRKMKEG